jgi:energy-coupling factor transporter transmembrane protein EcfT
MDAPGLTVLTGLFLCGLLTAGLPFRWIAASFRSWTPILLIVLVLNALDQGGAGLVAAPWLPVSVPSLKRALTACWRLALLLGFASLFSATTEPRALRDGIAWMLTPLPLIPARRVGFMAALGMRFLPLLLDELAEVRQAVKARLGDRTRNPLRRIRGVGLPLLRRCFLRAEELTLAIAARGYREDLPLRIAAPPGSHWAAATGVAVLVAGSLLVPQWVGPP